MPATAFLHRTFSLTRHFRQSSLLSASRRTRCARRAPSPAPAPTRQFSASAAPPPANSQHAPDLSHHLGFTHHATDGDGDTIFALATAPAAAAGVAIIRLSGPRALHALTCLQPPDVKPPPTRRAVMRPLLDPRTGELLDRALVLYFAAPASFTGEAVVELHLHGSRAVISAVSDALLSLPHPLRVRPAERGEFSRRAFENGRLDLTAAEGLADLIAAETPAQRRLALRHLDGAAREVLDSWRLELKRALAHVEAVIDFGEDVDDDVLVDVGTRVAALRDSMRAALDDHHRGEVVRDGASVAIVGPPNAGKSTLLNELARRPAAIVSPVAGTTRDVVEVRMDIGGFPVVVSDTAGLHEATLDPIEREGMRRARQAARNADIIIMVHDATDTPPATLRTVLPERIGLLRDDHRAEGEADGHLPDDTFRDNVEGGRREANVICVMNKMDLLGDEDSTKQEVVDGISVVRTSLVNKRGVDDVLRRLEEGIRQRLESGGAGAGSGWDADGAPLITRARHRHHLHRAQESLAMFLDGWGEADEAVRKPLDLAAEDLRIAMKEVGAITGAVGTEEVLDLIFSEFCIGK